MRKLIGVITALAVLLLAVGLSLSSSAKDQDAAAKAARHALGPALLTRKDNLASLRRIQGKNPGIRSVLLRTTAAADAIAGAQSERQLAAFRLAYKPAYDSAYPAAYQAAFPIDLGDSVWYVVRVKKASGYRTTAWRAPAGQEYVVNGGTVTRYDTGTAPNPYLSGLGDGSYSYSGDGGTSTYAGPGDVPGYYNSNGDWVPSPSSDPNLEPGGPTAICGDGSYSYSQSASGTCSWHGGVDTWLSHP